MKVGTDGGGLREKFVLIIFIFVAICIIVDINITLFKIYLVMN